MQYAQIHSCSILISLIDHGPDFTGYLLDKCVYFSSIGIDYIMRIIENRYRTQHLLLGHNDALLAYEDSCVRLL